MARNATHDRRQPKDCPGHMSPALCPAKPVATMAQLQDKTTSKGSTGLFCSAQSLPTGKGLFLPALNYALPILLPFHCHSFWLLWSHWCTYGLFTCTQLGSINWHRIWELSRENRGISLGKEIALMLLPLIPLSRKLFHSGWALWKYTSDILKNTTFTDNCQDSSF